MFCVRVTNGARKRKGERENKRRRRRRDLFVCIRCTYNETVEVDFFSSSSSLLLFALRWTDGAELFLSRSLTVGQLFVHLFPVHFFPSLSSLLSPRAFYSGIILIMDDRRTETRIVSVYENGR